MIINTWCYIGMSNQLHVHCTELDIKDPFVIRQYL